VAQSLFSVGITENALSNGALDTWSCGGGNTRVLKFDATTLTGDSAAIPFIAVSSASSATLWHDSLVKACFSLGFILGVAGLSRPVSLHHQGSEGWIIGVHSLEGVIGGHSWLGLFLISGGFWHVATQPFDALMRAFTWSGEAILGYSLSTLSLCSFTAAVQRRCVDQLDQKLHKPKHLLSCCGLVEPLRASSGL